MAQAVPTPHSSALPAAARDLTTHQRKKAVGGAAVFTLLP